MRPVIEFLVALIVVISLAVLISEGTVETVKQRDELQEKIDELLGREAVTLTDFVDAFGAPDDLTKVTCEGEACLKAIWDLSTATRRCWKRLVVVLSEGKRRIFMAETREIASVGQPPEEVRCVEVPR